MADLLSPEEKQKEIAKLEKLLRAREGKPGYAQNVEAIKARLEDIRG